MGLAPWLPLVGLAWPPLVGLAWLPLVGLALLPLGLSPVIAGHSQIGFLLKQPLPWAPPAQAILRLTAFVFLLRILANSPKAEGLELVCLQGC